VLETLNTVELGPWLEEDLDSPALPSSEYAKVNSLLAGIFATAFCRTAFAKGLDMSDAPCGLQWNNEAYEQMQHSQG